jgi:hypothetical protein
VQDPEPGTCELGDADTEHEYEEPSYLDADFSTMWHKSDKQLLELLEAGGELEGDGGGDSREGDESGDEDSGMTEQQQRQVQESRRSFLVGLDDPELGIGTDAYREGALAVEWVKQ